MYDNTNHVDRYVYSFLDKCPNHLSKEVVSEVLSHALPADAE